ncbi:MAG TPA: SOS response-associated peptidase [Anaerolineales bacterium]
MCGRFTLTVDPAELREAFSDYNLPAKYAPRYNIAPTQPILAIPNDDRHAADFFIWGLVPSWAKDVTIGSRLINARAETLAEKPSFRGSFKYKRCLILTDGFYEWQSRPGTKVKVPHFIFLKDHKPFAFAGLWDEWQSPEGGSLRTATIITTAPNQLMEKLHNRMPAILSPEQYEKWLDPAPQTPQSLMPLLQPFDASKMEAYPVSMLVNSPENDQPALIQPGQ